MRIFCIWICVLIGVVWWTNMTSLWHTSRDLLFFMLLHPYASEQAKREQSTGQVIDTFLTLIVATTPPNARVLIPPQHVLWGTEGNHGFMISTLYPRQVIQSKTETPTPQEMAQVDYVIVSPGLGIRSFPQIDYTKLDKSTFYVFDMVGRRAVKMNEGFAEVASQIFGLIQLHPSKNK